MSSSGDGRVWRVDTNRELADIHAAVAETVKTDAGTAAANQAMIAAGHRNRCTIMLLGTLGAGKTQLLANLMPDGSLAQEHAFRRVTHSKPAQHPVGFDVEETYTLPCNLCSLRFIDTPGIEPGRGADSMQISLDERIFPENVAASVDQVWYPVTRRDNDAVLRVRLYVRRLCVSVDAPKVLNADKVQALLLQLQQASLPTIVVLTKADRLFFEENFTRSIAKERSNIDTIIEDLKARFDVIKSHVYISTWRMTGLPTTQHGPLQFQDALDSLLEMAMNHLQDSKLAAFARCTAVTLDIKMAASAKAILYGIRWRAAFLLLRSVPILPEYLAVPYLLKKTFSRVYAVWGMDEASQKIVSKQLLDSDLVRKMKWWSVLKASLLLATFAAFPLEALVVAEEVAEIASMCVLVFGGQGVDFCSLVHNTIQLCLMQAGVIVQLSMLTGGNNWVLSSNPNAQQMVDNALVAYNSTCHGRVTEFCDRIKGKYLVFTEAQIAEVEKQLHQFLRELVQDCKKAYHKIAAQAQQ